MATEYESGEQWDKPNGWAPLQWMAIQGFKRYGRDPLGDEIASELAADGQPLLQAASQAD